MMTKICPPPSVLSGPQRRCHLLLTLCLPDQTVTPEYISRLNGVDDTVSRQDIADAAQALRRYHRLNLFTQPDGSYKMAGTALDRRLCLMYWLRRSLRLCPHYVHQQFTPALKTALKQPGISRALYDSINLQALINLCARRLQRVFTPPEREFLHLFLPWCLLQHQLGHIPQFTDTQRSWMQERAEIRVAQEIVHHWRRRVTRPPHDNEQHFLTALFMLLRTPSVQHDGDPQQRRLLAATQALMSRFHALCGLRFSNEARLRERLYVHLAQALNRSVFGIGIDSSLPQEITHLYPRLMRTTREAVRELEAQFNIHFSSEETGLIAIIFGAWLMQESALGEKQVLLLTGNDPALEEGLEQQLRELTLLPLNVRRLSLCTFQQEGAPTEVALIVTPYATSLPLFSPPLIHLTLPPGEHQLQRIREILES